MPTGLDREEIGHAGQKMRNNEKTLQTYHSHVIMFFFVNQHDEESLEDTKKSMDLSCI